MALRRRILRVHLDFPSGQKMIWDETLDLRVRISKAALALQSSATFDVGLLSNQSRQDILSNFTAYAKRLRERGEANDPDNFVNVRVEAGHIVDGTGEPSPIFTGQIALSEIVSTSPNMMIRATAYTHQIDKSAWVQRAPNRMTFKAYAEWCAQQMGLRADVQTSIDDQIVDNPGATQYTISALLLDLQNYSRQTVAAFIDDGTLFVLDIGKVAAASSVVKVDQFVGSPPIWNEWGVEFACLFNNKIKLATPLEIVSKTNPAIRGTGHIAMKIDYDLTTRQDPFNMKVYTSPSAGS